MKPVIVSSRSVMNVIENPESCSLKRVAWSYGCSKRDSEEERMLLAILLEKVKANGWESGLSDAIARVKNRRTHYEIYACQCVPTNGEHSRECDAMPMRTHDATFAIIDEILVFLEAMLERGGKR